MDGFVLAAVAVLAVMTGFWAGRSVQWQFADLDETADPQEALYKEVSEESGASHRRRERNNNYRRILLGKEIASPASGEMTASVEDGKRVIRIRPEQGKLYAPASGKIVHLYPMGCAMLLRTDFGAEIMLRAGDEADDIYSMYYRCRVMEREIVRRGSLLLEYDLEGLRSEGADTEVTMSLEGESGQESMTVPQNTRAKAGETILRI